MSERPADRPADRTEITGPHQSDVYDVWEPAPHRARGLSVALIHGGFWRERYDRHHLAPLARALADDGFHVANLEYARAGMPGGGWPGTGASVLAQLTAVHADRRCPSESSPWGTPRAGTLPCGWPRQTARRG